MNTLLIIVDVHTMVSFGLNPQKLFSFDRKYTTREVKQSRNVR